MEEASGLQSLNDDCITIIIEKLAGVTHTEWSYGDKACNSKDPLREFSMTDSHIRQLCIPKLFDLGDMIVRLYRRQAGLVSGLECFSASSFIADSIRSLKVCRDIFLPDDATYEWFANPKKEENNIDIFAKLIPLLEKSPNLAHLRLSHLKCMSVDSRTALQASQFTSIRALHFVDVPEAARLIGACPNLQLFCTSYPCPKPKITLKAVAKHTGIKYVELDCNLWSPKHLSDVCAFLKNVEILYLSGEIKAKITGMVDEIKIASSVQTLYITTDVWIDTSYLNKIYFDQSSSGYMDAVDDMKEESRLHEKPDAVATALFQACIALTKVGLIPRFDSARTYTAERDDNGALLKMSEAEIAPRGETYCIYSPLERQLEWWDRRWGRWYRNE
ncbi:uncharacterized protein AB675_9021 [Cyphellophora attinorum]|uniref:F-box protein n=1 Tax=Cyphellophora attinorum TaxID=1664694 RepID=A0A0N1HBL4_9EURO|nr:uncharacterized protein AB675_9021 [Phialophora attinorum]KPI41734.1 hypothetical protein AB675_9021 [Phialophora attinorum]